MKRIVLGVVLVAAVAFAGWFGMRDKVLTSSSSATVTALLPRETLGFLHVPDFNRSREQWHQTDLYNLWREPAVQEFLQKPLAKMPNTGGVRDKMQDLQALGMRDAFLAVTAWEDNGPKIAAGFRFKGTADDAEKVIGKWRTRLEWTGGGVRTSTADYEKHQMTLATRDAVTVATVYDGEWFLAGNDVELVKKMLDRVDGRAKDAGTTLASDDRYAAAFKHMPMGYAAFVYARLDAYFEKLAARMPAAAQGSQGTALRQIRSFAAASTFDSGKIRDVLFVEMPKRDNPTELSRGSLRLATANSFLYATSLVHLPDQMMLPAPGAATATGWAPKLQQKLAALGAKGVTIDDVKSAFALEGSVVGDWPQETRIPALLATLPVRDADKANRIVAALTEVADEDRPWTHSTKNGVQYYTLPPENPLIPFAPTIAVGSELLVAGIDPTSVDAAIARSSAGESPLAKTQPFKAAEALVPKPTQSFAFVDTALLYSRLDAALRPMLIMSAAFVPGIADAVDLGKLPAPEVITKHLSPIAMSQVYQTDGYVTESVGPVSIYQAAFGIAAASGAAMSFYQKQTGTAPMPVLPAISSSPAAVRSTPTPPDDGDDDGSADEP